MLGIDKKIIRTCAPDIVKGGGQCQKCIPGVQYAVFEMGRDDTRAVQFVVVRTEVLKIDASEAVFARLPVFKVPRD